MNRGERRDQKRQRALDKRRRQSNIKSLSLAIRARIARLAKQKKQ